MNRVVGRNIYIVDLASVVNSAGGPSAFAQQCQSCGFNAVWARLGYAQDLDDNFDPTKNVALPQILTGSAGTSVRASRFPGMQMKHPLLISCALFAASGAAFAQAPPTPATPPAQTAPP